MSMQDDFLQISTPENVAFSFPVAGIGSRFIAALIDTTIIIILQIIVLVFSGLAASLFFEIPDSLVQQDLFAAWVIGIFGVVSFVFLWGYYIFFEMLWNGQSPGKRAAKLRVIRLDGGPISLTESIVRNLIRLVDFLPMIYGLGVVIMFVDKKARRLGDLAANTIVVREPAADLEQMKNRAPLPKKSEHSLSLEGYGVLPVEMLTQEDLEIIRSFLQRRSKLSESSLLGEQILARVFKRFELPLPKLNKFKIINLLQAILTESEHQIASN